MKNYELQSDEVILYEDVVAHSDFKGSLEIILTSNKIVFEKEKGIFKKERELIDTVKLEDIKIYNDKVQIKQKGTDVSIQTNEKNFTVSFTGVLKANKFVVKIIDAITGTTITKRGTDKIKNTFNMIDDVLGLDTRDTIKGVVENGVVGTILKGNKKKK